MSGQVAWGRAATLAHGVCGAQEVFHDRPSMAMAHHHRPRPQASRESKKLEEAFETGMAQRKGMGKKKRAAAADGACARMVPCAARIVGVGFGGGVAVFPQHFLHARRCVAAEGRGRTSRTTPLPVL